MKQYLIDQLRPQDHVRIQAHLEKTLTPGGLPGIYRLPIPPQLLTGIQTSHTGCQPFFAAVELRPDALSCEFLIRSEYKLRCVCMGYATRAQRDWLMESMDAVLTQLDIRI